MLVEGLQQPGGCDALGEGRPLADVTNPRRAHAAAGVLLLATPLLLPRVVTEPSLDGPTTTDDDRPRTATPATD